MHDEGRLRLNIYPKLDRTTQTITQSFSLAIKTLLTSYWRKAIRYMNLAI